MTVGCLLGASCLLFMDLSAADRRKKAQDLSAILETVMVHGDEVIGAERSAVFWSDEKKNEMWSRYAGGDDGKALGEIFHVPTDSSVVGECKKEGRVLNIEDASRHGKFNGEKAKETGERGGRGGIGRERRTNATFTGMLSIATSPDMLRAGDGRC